MLTINFCPRNAWNFAWNLSIEFNQTLSPHAACLRKSLAHWNMLCMSTPCYHCPCFCFIVTHGSCTSISIWLCCVTQCLNHCCFLDVCLSPIAMQNLPFFSLSIFDCSVKNIQVMLFWSCFLLWLCLSYRLQLVTE